jgi:hypothetical protein
MNSINKIIRQDYKGISYECTNWSVDDFKNDDTIPLYATIAYKLNNDLKNGYYVEIGSNHFKDGSNTYFLEQSHNWNGISVEISKYYSELFNFNRKNKCINENALKINWEKYFEENNFPNIIDFLSIDIDSDAGIHANTLALLNLPLSRYKFNIIVIEHSGGSDYVFEHSKEIQRNILSMFGYYLICKGNTDDVWSRTKPDSINGFGDLNNIIRRVSNEQ